jgi:hypothetical protein
MGSEFAVWSRKTLEPYGPGENLNPKPYGPEKPYYPASGHLRLLSKPPERIQLARKTRIES